MQYETQARIELDFVDAAEQKIPHKERDHMDRGGRGGFGWGEPLERWIPFASEPQNLPVKMLFARKMPEQQRLGNAAGLGQLLGGRGGNTLPATERYARRDDRFAPFVAV